MKKKMILLLAIFMAECLSLFSQAVKDRNVLALGVSLNEVLRLTISGGDNIEFVFNNLVLE